MNVYYNFSAASKVAPAKFEGFKSNGSQIIVTMSSKSVVGLEIVLK